mmetsp:Transcript_10350/g.33011  ORF Transcript_10350/g.33011 Transcript_10350/m.33011 type:complete len:101 (+) Transcript_10350:1124-1426(+)
MHLHTSSVSVNLVATPSGKVPARQTGYEPKEETLFSAAKSQPLGKSDQFFKMLFRFAVCDSRTWRELRLFNRSAAIDVVKLVPYANGAIKPGSHKSRLWP